MMDQRVLLMVNPMAGRQKIRNELIYVVDALTKAGYETDVYKRQIQSTVQGIGSCSA